MSGLPGTEPDPTADCRGVPGRVAPDIDRNRCEGKARCVEVCPFDVFEIQRLAPQDRQGLSFVGTIKAWAHGHRQAYAVRAESCQACGRCVVACPEDAIHLVPGGSR